MRNKDKTKNKRNDIFIDNYNNNSFHYLNHSFQNSGNKLKLKYSFLDNINLSNFKKSIILKINQIQNNQQKTNIKLSSIINLLLSKLIGNQNYTLFHHHFSIIQNKKNKNIFIKKDINNVIDRIMTDTNQENKTERANVKNKIIKKKIENISLATESDIKRYNISNHKTKIKENIFQLNDENQYNTNNKNTKNEEFNQNCNNNLFRINNNHINNNSLNKISSNDDFNNQKKIFNVSNNRKPITFNEISSNINNQNNNYYSYNKEINKLNSFNSNNRNNTEKIYINASNISYNKNHKSNNNISTNSINKENKSNISENKVNKWPIKIKLNSIEKPILLMNLNDNINKGNIKKSNNIINISNNSNSNSNEKKENKNYNLMIENKRLSFKIDDDSSNNLKNMNDNDNGVINIDNIDSTRSKRNFSEAKSDAESVYSNFSDAKPAKGYSRKIRGFNFRNNIKFNKKPNSRKESEDTFNRIKGGSVRYISNNDLFGQVNSLQNESK
jgi:hypothetical protein